MLTYKKLDSILNVDGTEGRITDWNDNASPARITLARLAGNPRFEELCSELRANADADPYCDPALRGEPWDNLVEYLRTQVHPVNLD